jgi:hypothetical protein
LSLERLLVRFFTFLLSAAILVVMLVPPMEAPVDIYCPASLDHKQNHGGAQYDH